MRIPIFHAGQQPRAQQGQIPKIMPGPSPVLQRATAQMVNYSGLAASAQQSTIPSGPFVQRAGVVGAFGQALEKLGDTLGQIAEHRQKLINEGDIADALLAARTKIGELAIQRNTMDPGKWDGHYAEQMDAFEKTLYKDGLSPFAKHEIEYRYQHIRGQGAIATGMAASRALVDRNVKKFQAGIEMGIETSDPFLLQESREGLRQTTFMSDEEYDLMEHKTDEAFDAAAEANELKEWSKRFKADAGNPKWDAMLDQGYGPIIIPRMRPRGADDGGLIPDEDDILSPDFKDKDDIGGRDELQSFSPELMDQMRSELYRIRNEMGSMVLDVGYTRLTDPDNPMVTERQVNDFLGDVPDTILSQKDKIRFKNVAMAYIKGNFKPTDEMLNEASVILHDYRTRPHALAERLGIEMSPDEKLTSKNFQTLYSGVMEEILKLGDGLHSAHMRQEANMIRQGYLKGEKTTTDYTMSDMVASWKAQWREGVYGRTRQIIKRDLNLGEFDSLTPELEREVRETNEKARETLRKLLKAREDHPKDEDFERHGGPHINWQPKGDPDVGGSTATDFIMEHDIEE